MLKFRTVAVMVRDEKKAAKFWTQKVGFKLHTSWPHWYTVQAPGSRVLLHLCIDGRREKGNTGFLFSTKDIKREHARLKRKGVRITMPITKADWGSTFMFADPDGNEFWVIEG